MNARELLPLVVTQRTSLLTGAGFDLSRYHACEGGFDAHDVSGLKFIPGFPERVWLLNPKTCAVPTVAKRAKLSDS